MRARLVERAADWRWSSLHACLDPERGDGLTRTAPVLSRYPDFAVMIADGEDETLSLGLRRAETIGRPVGDAAFVARLEALAGRPLAPGKRGRSRRRRLLVHCHCNAGQPLRGFRDDTALKLKSYG